jgi:hypothetical protein
VVVVVLVPEASVLVLVVFVSSPQPTIATEKQRVNSIAVNFFIDTYLGLLKEACSRTGSIEGSRRGKDRGRICRNCEELFRICAEATNQGNKKREFHCGVEASHTLRSPAVEPSQHIREAANYFVAGFDVSVVLVSTFFVDFDSSPQPTIIRVKQRVNSIAVNFFIDSSLNVCKSPLFPPPHGTG